MLHTWTAGLPKDEAEALSIRLKTDGKILSRLSYILDQRLKDSVEKQTSQTSYSVASWPYFQADSIGYQRAIRELLSLINSVGR